MSTGRNKIRCPQCKHTQWDEWQFCQKCLYNLHRAESFSIITPPTWVQLANSLNDPARMNPKYEIEVQDRVEAEKRKELKTSKKAQSWERGRKAEAKRNKPYYLRKFHGK